MPLESGSSKAAFGHNVSEERKAGKPEDQAVAIAYATKRGDANSPEYEAAIKKHDVALKEYDTAIQAYRARKMDDKEYLAARKKRDVATAEFDKTYSKAAGWNRSDAGYMDNNAKLDVALAKCAKVDAMCATDPVKLAGMRCAD